MSENLGRKNLPSGHSPEDFECSGPPATKDGEFAGTKICDMGCFRQGETDSNKFYHGSVVKSKKNGKWFAYFEWGRVGNNSNDFQFIECADANEAQEEYEAQLHSKNDKRGQWTTIAGIKTLEPKPGKDCYLVRPQAKRSTGLPDGRTITSNDGAKKASVPVIASKTSAAAKPKADAQTLSLMRDLNVATVAFTRGSMAGGSIPTQGAIDEGRQILTEAQKRVLKVGDNINSQINDKDLVQFSSLLYSKIPKVKRIGAPAAEWILSSDNILGWQKDLDAFESALYTAENSVQQESDPFNGMPLDMSWIDPKSSVGNWVYRWPAKATKGRHGYGKMTIHNAWKVSRHGDENRLFKCQDEIAAERDKNWVRETALHQEEPPAMSSNRMKTYRDSNSAMLFHGTRSVNVSGILRKSLLLPKQLVGVVISGAMFGQGAYFADDYMKSAGYTSLRGSYWSGGAGGITGRHAFMFIVEATCGNPFVATGPKGYTNAPAGHHCVFGKGGYSQVQNNEWVFFNTNQFMLRYLIEFDC